MNKKEFLSTLRPKGTYAQTDLSLYSSLSAGVIKTILIYKKLSDSLPIFALIEDKDTSIGSEVEARVSAIENKYYTHKVDATYNNSIDEIISAAMEAIIYGIGIVELSIDNQNNIIFSKIDKEKLFFEDNVPYLKSGKTKINITEPRFMLFERKKPILRKVLWIVYAKHFVLSHYMKFAEFLGVPPMVANVEDSSDETLTTVADSIRGLKSGGYTVLGKEDMLKVLEGRGSQADFLKFVQYADSEIAKVINGSTLTSNTGTAGSYAQANIHAETKREITARDAKYVTSCVKRVFKLIDIDIDFALLIEKDKDLLQRANIIKIASDIGFEMSDDDISKELDLPLKSKNTKISQNFKKIINKRLAINAKKIPIDNIDKALESKEFSTVLEKNEIKIKKELEKILLKAESFEEAFTALIEAYPDVDMDELEDTFTSVMISSELLGAENEF